MKQKRLISTIEKPLNFFQYIFIESNIIEFENKFYINDGINLIYRESGYIFTDTLVSVNKASEILGDSNLEYYEDELQFIKIYFKDYLKKELEKQYLISKEIINGNNLQLQIENKNNEIYLNSLQEILNEIKFSYNYKHLDLLEEYHLKLLNFINSKLKNKPQKSNSIKSTKHSYFGADNLNKTYFKKVYKIVEEFEIIDSEVFTFESFYDFYCSKNPLVDNIKFIFNCKNDIAVFFLDTISPKFTELTFAKIAKSKSFITKGGKIFTQANLDTTKSRYSKMELNPTFIKLQSKLNQ